MRRATVHLLTLIVALAAGRAVADGPKVTMPAAVSGAVGEWVIIPFSVEGGRPQWGLPDRGLIEIPLESIFGPEVASQAKAKIVRANAAGRYRLWAWNAAGSVASAASECVVTIGLPPSPPPGPTPPEPGPGPSPGPAPIPLPGLRVLMVTESADLSKLPAAQVAVFTSADVRAYLNAKCAVGANGVTREWRQWDKDVVTTNEASHWQAVMARPRQSLPWLVISTGAAGYEGPLPATVAETLTLLKKFGG